MDEISENKYELVISYPDKEDPKGLRLFFIKVYYIVILVIITSDC